MQRLHPRQRYSRIHLYLITQALIISKRATSYQLKDLTDNLAKKYVKLTHRKGDLHKCQMGLRTVQYILVDLKKKGKVNNDKNTKRPVYYLTEAGYQQKLFGEPLGRALFEGLTEIPLNGTDQEKVLESINRLGIYLIYIFMNGLALTWGSHMQQIIAKYDTEWINEAINGELIFKWFSSQFPLDKIPRTLKGRRYNEIMQPLYEHFPKLIQKLQLSEMAFNRKFFEAEFTANKKWLDSFEPKK